jgi:hypothetical protein
MWVWLSNTEELSVVEAGIDPVSPGGAVALPAGSMGPGGCVPVPERLYRESFGRWRLTHVGGADGPWVRDEVTLWSWPKTRAYFSALPCRLPGSPVTLTIPDDVTWSPVVACASNGACVRVDVATEAADP